MSTAVHKRSAASATTPAVINIASPSSGTTTSSMNNDSLKYERKRNQMKHQSKWAKATLFPLLALGLGLLCISIFVLSRIVMEPPSEDRDDDRSGNSILRGIKASTSGKKGADYVHSDWMPNVGDKSGRYARLREEYDALLPEDDVERMRKFVKSLKKSHYTNAMANEMSYDINNCPFDPPAEYPHAWNVKEVLKNWPPDDPTKRPQIYQGLCVFDFETEREKAMNYRKAEVPFVIQNDPSVLRTTERWNQKGYMEKLLGRMKHRTEYSEDNHFMYWTPPRKNRGGPPKDWSPPTKMMRMPYQEWLEHATVDDDTMLGPDHEHWYYRLIGCGEMGDCDKGSSEYLFDELAFFQPRFDNDLYMVKPKKQKGIHCRFGMKGVIAENHFDGSRNMIAVMGGERRYILSHPDQCENLELYPRGHPSARHSAVDWSEPDYDEFPAFADAEVNEIIMQAGDVLYLPTNWFHYIISLELNFQCNTRSGVSKEYMSAIHECGF